MSRRQASIILVLLIERSSQVFPGMNVGSFQLVELLKLSVGQTLLKEMDPQISVGCMRLDLSNIIPQMKFGERDPIIFSKSGDLEFVRDNHPWNQP